jgi:hypothetical protein
MGVRFAGQVSASFHLTVLPARAGVVNMLMSSIAVRVIFTIHFIGPPQRFREK